MTPPLLQVAGVHKRFGRVVTADDVTFAVCTGEILGIVGPNGAGKTTLLSVVNGSVRPDSGSIRFDGSDITRLGTAERSVRGIARTHQVPRPFAGLTVFENVLVGGSFGGGLRRQQAYDRAYDALASTDMIRLANHRAGQLRLLDRKRLELARALATAPRLLLLDEIAGGLTDAELPALVDTIDRLRDAGLALVWIEHIVHALLQAVDRLMCLAGGRVIALGDPETVIRSPEVTEVYLGASAEPEGGTW